MSSTNIFRKFWNKSSISDATEYFNLVYILAAIGLWLGGLVLIALQAQSKDHGSWYLFGELFFFSAAAFIIGVLGGFLFGIPKTLQHTTPPGGSGTTINLLDKLITNTNLEQISDWLTKIIVGLGLINLKKIPVYIEQLRVNFAAALGGTDKSISYVAVAMVIYASVSGFIWMYVYTRVNLTSLFLKNSMDGQQLLNAVIDKMGGQTPENKSIREGLITKLQAKDKIE